MRVNDGGATGASGLPWPPGDPAAVRAAAADLRRSAHAVGQVIDAFSPRIRETLRDWHSPAAHAFLGSATTVQSGLHSLGDVGVGAARILSDYADALERAQDLARRAEHDLASAGQAYRAAVTSATSALSAATGAAVHAAQTAATRAENDAYTTLRGATWSAQSHAQQACHEASVAARTAASKLGHLASDTRSMSLKEFLDKMGGPGALLVLGSMPALVKSSVRLWDVFAALRSGNWLRISRLNPQAWADVVKIEAQLGDYAGLKASFAMQENLWADAAREFKSAATAIGPIPEGKALAVFDMLSKAGTALAVFGDGYTLFADPSAKARDKWLAGANLAGAGLAESGALLGALGVADGVTAAVPIVGEVMFAVTGVTVAGLWIHDHWDAVSRFADSAGSTLVSAGETAGSTVVSGAEAVGHGLASGGSWLVHEAGGLLSDIGL